MHWIHVQASPSRKWLVGLCPPVAAHHGCSFALSTSFIKKTGRRRKKKSKNNVPEESTGNVLNSLYINRVIKKTAPITRARVLRENTSKEGELTIKGT